MTRVSCVVSDNRRVLAVERCEKHDKATLLLVSIVLIQSTLVFYTELVSNTVIRSKISFPSASCSVVSCLQSSYTALEIMGRGGFF